MILALACASAGTIPLTIGDTRIRVEVADEEVERSQGLMFRDTLAADAGMLFVYPDVRERTFWMKNTRVPLSVAFLDPTGVIVRIADMRPLDTNLTASGAPVGYALEMNRGWFAAHGVREGDRVAGLPEAPK